MCASPQNSSVNPQPAWEDTDRKGGSEEVGGGTVLSGTRVHARVTGSSPPLSPPRSQRTQGGSQSARGTAASPDPACTPVLNSNPMSVRNECLFFRSHPGSPRLLATHSPSCQNPASTGHARHSPFLGLCPVVNHSPRDSGVS